MTNKYYLVRRDINENVPTYLIKRSRSIKQISKLYKIPFLIIFIAFLLSLLLVVAILVLNLNPLFLVIPCFIAILINCVSELPNEKFIYNMNERNKEIEKKNENYQEYVKDIKRILDGNGINNPQKIQSLKKECEAKINESKNKLIGIKDNVLGILIILPLTTMISTFIYDNIFDILPPLKIFCQLQ